MTQHDTLSPEILRQLAPVGDLAVAINLSNFLLVSGKGQDGAWKGVAPDLARLLADALGASLTLVPYDTPSQIADAVDTGAWAVALIGAEPARAEKITFTEAYVEIEAGYLVPPASPLMHLDEVDRPGHRIAAYQGSAYDLWLTKNLRHATLMHAKSFDAAFERFVEEGLDALATLRPKLPSDCAAFPGSRILPGRFMSVRQAAGVSARHGEAAAWLQAFIRRVKASGLIAPLIDKHNATGLTASPLTDQ